MCGCNKDKQSEKEVGEPRQTRIAPMTITAQLSEPKEQVKIEDVVKQPEMPKRLIKFL